jgi:UDP-N-acetylglucosamine 1-carboxyvinyltransferase
MGEYHVIGKERLIGKLNLPGSKNSTLPILAATILNSGESVIYNYPKILDIYYSLDILKELGCRVILYEDAIVINSSSIDSFEVPQNLTTKMRSSIFFLGPILSRLKKVKIFRPGGCALGDRPIDIHVNSIRNMNIDIEDYDDFIICKTKDLLAATVKLDFPSVGATENIMMSAVFAKGVTIIHNPAKEPEILDLQRFLNSMGAKVNGAGTNVITIEGVDKLNNYVEYKVASDRIVAGTFLTATAMTNGELELGNVNLQDISSIVATLLKVGCNIKFDDHANVLYMKSIGLIKPLSILTTRPHPGFPTDMQPQFTALLSIASGTSFINETLFEARYRHITELNKMGANISKLTSGRLFKVSPVDSLYGANVKAYDLRGGIALVIAALAAEGKTIVKETHHIERGYEDIERDFTSLGLKVRYLAT